MECAVSAMTGMCRVAASALIARVASQRFALDEHAGQSAHRAVSAAIDQGQLRGEPLIATAFGIFIAIFALFGFNYFSRRQVQALEEMEHMRLIPVDIPYTRSLFVNKFPKK